jgi:hypothetical protein
MDGITGLLNTIVWQQHVKVRSGLNWLKTGYNGIFYKHGNEPPGSPAEQLSTIHYGSCTVKFVTYSKALRLINTNVSFELNSTHGCFIPNSTLTTTYKTL